MNKTFKKFIGSFLAKYDMYRSDRLFEKLYKAKTKNEEEKIFYSMSHNIPKSIMLDIMDQSYYRMSLEKEELKQYYFFSTLYFEIIKYKFNTFIDNLFRF